MGGYNKEVCILKKIISYCDEIEKTTLRFGKSLEEFRQDEIYRNAC